MTEDLNAILRTIREVEDSLERRAARAEGANVMVWGVVAATIFAFYQLVEWNPDPYVDALGPFLSWAWLPPMVVGYVLSGIVGARLGRMGATLDQKRAFRRGWLIAVFVGILVTTLTLTQRYHYIYGGVTLLGGATCVAFAWPSPKSPARTTSIAVGAAMSILGTALLVLWDAPWAAGAAAFAYLAGYLTLGTVLYRRGR